MYLLQISSFLVKAEICATINLTNLHKFFYTQITSPGFHSAETNQTVISEHCKQSIIYRFTVEVHEFPAASRLRNSPHLIAAESPRGRPTGWWVNHNNINKAQQTVCNALLPHSSVFQPIHVISASLLLLVVLVSCLWLRRPKVRKRESSWLQKEARL